MWKKKKSGRRKGLFCYNFEVLGLVLSLFQSSNNLFESSQVKVLNPMKPLVLIFFFFPSWGRSKHMTYTPPVPSWPSAEAATG